jgi:hypothetical protein
MEPLVDIPFQGFPFDVTQSTPHRSDGTADAACSTVSSDPAGICSIFVRPQCIPQGKAGNMVTGQTMSEKECRGLGTLHEYTELSKMHNSNYCTVRSACLHGRSYGAVQHI